MSENFSQENPDINYKNLKCIMCFNDPFFQDGDKVKTNDAVFIINGQSVCYHESHIVSATTGSNLAEAILYVNEFRRRQGIE